MLESDLLRKKFQQQQKKSVSDFWGSGLPSVAVTVVLFDVAELALFSGQKLGLQMVGSQILSKWAIIRWTES